MKAYDITCCTVAIKLPHKFKNCNQKLRLPMKKNHFPTIKEETY